MITIEGREWPVTRPTSGQMMALGMIANGSVGREKAGMLTMKLVLQLLLDEEARAAFIGEFISGGYEVEHLLAVVNSIVADIGSDAEEPDEPAADTAPVPRRTAKKAAAKTAPSRRRQ